LHEIAGSGQELRVITGYEKLCVGRKVAGPMAPQDRTCAHLQDSYFRRMWRLANTLAKAREGILQKKDVKKRRTKPLCV